jgi:c-di-AMP phosphodiesterase-like protein
MGGGGHFDAAGAQTDVGSEATLTRLQKAIDDYEAELLQSRENANHQ